MPTTIRKLSFPWLFFLLLTLPTFAQDETPKEVNNQNRSGDLPFSSSVGTEVESVDISTGHLSVRIPFVSLPGRGMNYRFGIRYDSGYWVTALRGVPGTFRYYWKVEKRTYVPDNGLGWQTTQPRLTHTQWRENCGGTSFFVTHQDSYIYHDPDGGAHPLDLESQAAHCQWPSGSGVDQGGYNAQTGTAPDTSGVGMWASNWWPTSSQKLRLADGTLLVGSGVRLSDDLGNSSFNYEDLYGGYVDANGNQKSEYPGGLDTLGRSIVTQQNGTNQVLFKVYDSTGTLQTYAVNYVPITLSTHFNITNTSYGLIIENTETRSAITSIVLPNGRSFLFQYETNGYGGISRIDFPTGAYVTYTWGTWIDSLRTYRYVTSRTLTVDGQSYTWTFTRGAPVYGNAESFPVTVTDPLLNQTAYMTDHGSITSAMFYTGSASGNPLRQYAVDYSVLYGYRSSDETGRLPTRITTTLENGQVSKKEYDYDSVSYDYQTCYDALTCAMNATPDSGTYSTSRGNVTEIREYDYDQGVPGALLRRTHNDYGLNSDTNYVSRNIVDKITQTTVYDSTGNTCKGLSQPCAQTQYEYDNYAAGDNPLQSTTNAAQHDYTNYPYTFTARGNATRVKRWRNTDGALITTTYQYDDLGNMRAIKDPLTHTTSYDYTDSFSNTFCPPPTGKNGQAYVSQVTNPLGQHIQVVRFPCTGFVQAHKDQNDINAARAGTTFTYDLLGRLTQKTLGDGGQVATTYNDVSPISSTSTTKITSTLNLAATTIADGLGRIKQERLTSDPQGTIYGDTTYDGLGHTSTASNPYRNTNEATYGISTSQYDALSRVTKLIPPDGTSSANNVFTVYSGNCTTVTDQAGKTRKSCTDALGRLIQVFEPDATNALVNETDYQYDTLDNLICAVQKGTETTAFSTCAAAPTTWRPRSFTYNSLSQLLTATNPESGTISYAYDADGNLLTKTAPAPNQTGTATVTTTFSYDVLHRLTQKSFSDGTTPTVKYGFDGTALTGCVTAPPTLSITNGIGRRTAMCDAAGAEAWSYDTMGRVLTDRRTTNSVTKDTTYTYNLDGSVATLTYPSGRMITYSLQYSGSNTAGRFASAVDTANTINYATEAAYSPQGALSSLTNGAGLVSTFYYNSRLQPCRISVKKSGTGPTFCEDPDTLHFGNILDFQYNFSVGTANNGNVSRITNNSNAGRSVTYSYDELNRIKSAVTDATSGQFCWAQLFGEMVSGNYVSGYDIWGNLKKITPDPSRPGCGVNTLDLAINTANRITNTGYAYDTTGNMTADPATSSTYHYDAENRIDSVSGTLGAVAYRYDGDGKRLWKAPSATPNLPNKLYWYGVGSDPLDETDGTGSTGNASFNEYIFFNGKRTARRNYLNSVNYYFADHLGTARVVTDAAGTVLDDSEFYPFGGERPVLATSGNNYKFTAKERDQEFNLDNFGARNNSSSVGRFMTPDPSGLSFADASNPQSLNLYAYVQNNPLAFVDPDGLGALPAGKCGSFLCLLSAIGNFFRGGGGSGSGGGSSVPPDSPFQNLWSHYPRYSQYPTFPQPGHQTIWQHAGGHVQMNEKVFVNSCVIRMCQALNQSGYKILHLPSTVSDANHEWNFHLLRDLQPFLIQKFGKPEHYAAKGPNSWRGQLAGRTGILMFQVDIWPGNATGHAALWNGQNLSDEGEHDYSNVASGVLFWPIQ